MRTTLTLDDDVAALLSRAVKRRGGAFKDTVNEALRLGLEAMARPSPRARYRVDAVQSRGEPGGEPRQCRGSVITRRGRGSFMILVDANLLVYAHDAAAPEHQVAKTWFEGALERRGRVGLPGPRCWRSSGWCPTPRLSVRQLLQPRRGSTSPSGWHIDGIWVPQPGERHAELLGALLADTRVTSRMVPDAHLAAIALEHGLTLCSTDGDFAKFPGLRWENPLAA